LNVRPKHTTKNDRIVYGGGGITPDIIVKRNYDLSKSTMNIFSQDVRVFFKFAQKYGRKHPEYKNDIDNFLYNVEFDENFIPELYEFAVKDVKELKEEELAEDRDYLEMQIKSELAKIWWNNNAYYEARLLSDNQFKKAFQSMKEAQKFMAIH